MQILSARQAADLVENGDSVLVSGSGGGHAIPEAILEAVEQRFLETGGPRDLCLVHVVGLGDRAAKGAARFAHPGMLRRSITSALVDSPPLIELARTRGCQIYLPRIDRARCARGMRFVALGAPLRSNRLGIDEPAAGAVLGARWLDLIFLPLTAFDRHGVRLGTGGGYYDRALAFRRWRRHWHAPRLIGVGYAFQELPHLERAVHDVLMDAVVTEEGMIRCLTG